MRAKFRRRDEGEPSDGELVHQFQSGREEAFVELMSRHERRVFNLAYRMLGRTEDARDATQEAFLSCFRHLAGFRGDSAFTTWLHRIAVNACYDTLRRRPPPTASVEDRPDLAAAPDHADQAAASADVQRALLAVAPDFRVVLVLHEVQDLPVEVIAEALDIPVGTVKSRLHRGRVALARALEAESRPTRDAGPVVQDPEPDLVRHDPVSNARQQPGLAGGPRGGPRVSSPLEPRPAAAPSNPPIT